MLTNTGTLHFKAPEMFEGEYNEQIDIWAIGVIAYLMGYGFAPFQSQYEHECIKRITQASFTFPQKGTRSVSFQNFIKGCLEKEPVKRFTAIEALSEPFLAKNEIGKFLSSPPMMKVASSKLDQRTRKRSQTIVRDHKGSVSTTGTQSNEEIEQLN